VHSFIVKQKKKCLKLKREKTKVSMYLKMKEKMGKNSNVKPRRI